MRNIKNIDLIKHLLTEDQLQDLEAGATLHKNHSRIEFKILENLPRLIQIAFGKIRG